MLINIYDVIDKTPLKGKNKAACNNIGIIEQAFLCSFLGLEFYNCLLEDLVDESEYKDNPNYKGVWNMNTTYALGDIVFYNGSFFTMKELHPVGVKKKSVPDCSKLWKVLPRFKTACYQKFWDEVLCFLVSWVVYRRAIPFIYVISSTTGLKIQDSDGTGAKGIDKAALADYYKAADSMILDGRNLVEIYVYANKDKCDFSKCGFLQHCEPKKKHGKRRFYLRN